MTTENKTDAVPEGYMKNALGHLVPRANVREQDLLRDEVARNLTSHASVLSQALADFKKKALSDIADLVRIAGDRYDVQLGGKKGNVTLTSFDGEFRLMVAMSDTLAFDERLQAAKKLIDECLEEWTQNSDANLKTVVQAAFDVNKQGHINTGRVLGLRRLNIHHEKWSEAMNILSDSIQVLASKEYVRFYQRNTDGKYELINLDLATV